MIATTTTNLSGVVEDQVGHLEDVVGRQLSEDGTLPFLISHLFQSFNLFDEIEFKIQTLVAPPSILDTRSCSAASV